MLKNVDKDSRPQTYKQCFKQLHHPKPGRLAYVSLLKKQALIKDGYSNYALKSDTDARYLSSAVFTACSGDWIPSKHTCRHLGRPRVSNHLILV